MISRHSRNSLDYLSVKPMTLDRIQFAAQQTLGETTLGSMDLTAVEQVGASFGRGLVARLTAEVLGQNLELRQQEVTEPVEWHMPATWWQHWKATTGTRWRLGRWWNRRHPPRMLTVSRDVTTRIVWDERVGYPHADLPLPALGDPVLYVQPSGLPYRPEPSAPTYRN